MAHMQGRPFDCFSLTPSRGLHALIDLIVYQSLDFQNNFAFKLKLRGKDDPRGLCHLNVVVIKCSLPHGSYNLFSCNYSLGIML